MGKPLVYTLKGNRQGFEIRQTDEIKHCADGYTEVRRGGAVAAVYMTKLLRTKNTPDSQGDG
jgi:hypothetical protein